jgi:hypothetical protein
VTPRKIPSLEGWKGKCWKIALVRRRTLTEKLEKFAQSPKMILVFKERRCASSQGKENFC